MPASAKSKSKAKPATKPAAAVPAGATARALKKGDHLFLVDGSGYIFRAYHALPPLTRKSDGLQVNAVLGFCNMLWKLLAEMKDDKPTHLAVVFDKSEKTFRSDFYPEYKAHRPEAPEDLRPQFPLIREAVHAFEIPCLEQAGYEADDLIATYARLACEAKATTTIVSSDKDLMQLVGNGVTMYDTMKDRRIGRDEVIEKFGVGPEKVIEVQALIGNSTDNVPGVPGIGVKTAAQLIGEYGDLETLLKRASEIKQEKRRQSLIDNAEIARVSKRLVTLDQNVPLDVPVDELAVHEPDYKHLIAFLKAMEFSTITRRIAEKSGIDASQVEADSKLSSSSSPQSQTVMAGLGPAIHEAAPNTPGGRMDPRVKPGGDSQSTGGGKESAGALTPIALATARSEIARTAKIDRSKYETVGTLARLKEWIARAHENGVVAIDTETTSLDAMQAGLCGFSLALAPNEACYVPLAHREGSGGSDLFAPEAKLCPGQITEKDALAALKPLLEDEAVLKIGQNLKYDWLVFAQRGIEMAGTDDTMLISYVLDAGKGGHGMDDLAKRWLNHDTIHFKDVAGSGKTQVSFDCVAIDKATEYAAEDADVTLRLWYALKPRLAAERMTTVYETLERAMPAVLARMERRGISIDRQVLSRLSGEFAQEAAGLEDEIQKLAGEPVNPGSPKQLGDILFGKMALPGGSKTKTGQWSTGARELEELAEQGHELPRKNSRLAPGLETALDLHGSVADLCEPGDAARAHLLRARRHFDRSAVVVGAEPAEHPGAHRGRPQDPQGFRGFARHEAGVGRLLPDRAAATRRNRRHRGAEEGVPGRRRHPCHDRVGNVRRTGEGHARRSTPPRQSNQFRHHLRNLRLRPRQPARHRARGSRRLHQEIFRALPRHPRLHGRDARVLPRQRLCGDAVRPQVPLPRHQELEPVDPRLQRARGDQRTPARQRGRHHPPRHDPHRAGACEGEAQRADAIASPRRINLRSAGERGRKDPASGQARNGKSAGAGGDAERAPASRGPRRRQLGRGALDLAPHGEERGNAARLEP